MKSVAEDSRLLSTKPEISLRGTQVSPETAGKKGPLRGDRAFGGEARNIGFYEELWYRLPSPSRMMTVGEEPEITDPGRLILSSFWANAQKRKALDRIFGETTLCNQGAGYLFPGSAPLAVGRDPGLPVPTVHGNSDFPKIAANSRL